MPTFFPALKLFREFWFPGLDGNQNFRIKFLCWFFLWFRAWLASLHSFFSRISFFLKIWYMFIHKMCMFYLTRSLNFRRLIILCGQVLRNILNSKLLIQFLYWNQMNCWSKTIASCFSIFPSLGSIEELVYSILMKSSSASVYFLCLLKSTCLVGAR